MLKINLIFIVFCYSVLSSCGLGDLDSQNSSYHTIIDGQVLDKITGSPIDSAEVELSKSAKSLFGFDHKILTMYTNSDGKFYIDNHCTDDDRYRCSFSLDIYKKSYSPIYDYEHIEEGTENNIVLYLIPYYSYHTIINGQVLDKSTGNPIEKAEVVLNKSFRSDSNRKKILTVYTNNEGKFYIDNNCTDNGLYICDFSLDIAKNSYQPITSFADIEEGTENKVTIYLTPE